MYLLILVGVIGLLSVFVIPTLITGVLALGSALSFLFLNPIGLVILGIAGIIAAGILLVKNWDKVKNAAVNLGIGIQNVFIGIANTVLKVWNFIVSLMEKRINTIIDNIINPILKLAGLKELSGVSLSRFKAEELEFKEFRTLPPKLPEAGNNLVGGTTVNIENVNGLSGKDIARELEDELGGKVSLG